MSEVAQHWRTVAGRFTERAEAVPADAWANPSPCAGWTARDIVGHLVGWVPPFLESGAGITIDGIPAVDTDPATAWAHLNHNIQAILDHACGKVAVWAVPRRSSVSTSVLTPTENATAAVIVKASTVGSWRRWLWPSSAGRQGRTPQCHGSTTAAAERDNRPLRCRHVAW